MYVGELSLETWVIKLALFKYLVYLKLWLSELYNMGINVYMNVYIYVRTYVHVWVLDTCTCTYM